MGIKDIRDELAVALTDIQIGSQTIQVSPYRPGQIQPPTLLIEPDRVAFDGAFDRGHDSWFLNLRFLVATASNESALELRDEVFVGAADIKNAIEDHVPLRDGTIAQSAFVRQARNFGTWEVSGVAYVGVEFVVEVIA